jgi:hypothetical protein
MTRRTAHRRSAAFALRTFVALPSFLVLASAGCATRAPVPAEPLPAFIAFLREVHPDPHRFVSAAELDERLDAEMEMLDADSHPLSVARGASRLVAAIGDAHLAVGLPTEVSEGPQIPFLVKRAGERVFLDASVPSLPLGTEVLAIDGRPVTEMLNSLAELASVDGARPAVRAAQAERRFAAFALMQLGARDRYEISVRRPGGNPETIALDATDRQGASALAGARRSAPFWGGGERHPGEPAWPTLVRVDETTQILRLPTFGIADAAAYEERITSLFATLAPEERLVLDLRGNEGGFRMLGVAVLRHLLDRPFTQWDRVSTRVRAIPRGYRDLISFPFPGAGEAALRGFPGVSRDGGWVLEGDPLADHMRPGGDPHPGPIVVFVNEATNSAAIELLAALLANREGVQVIGSETQGACDRHSGEIPVLFRSGKLGVLVSLFDIDLVPIPRCVPGGGIVPDIEIVYTEEDFLQGRDPYLAALRPPPVSGPLVHAEIRGSADPPTASHDPTPELEPVVDQ